MSALLAPALVCRLAAVFEEAVIPEKDLLIEHVAVKAKKSVRRTVVELMLKGYTMCKLPKGKKPSVRFMYRKNIRWEILPNEDGWHPHIAYATKTKEQYVKLVAAFQGSAAIFRKPREDGEFNSPHLCWTMFQCVTDHSVWVQVLWREKPIFPRTFPAPKMKKVAKKK